MFDVILISHGTLSSAMITSAEMIVGEQENVETFSLCLGDSVDELRLEVLRCVQMKQAAGKEVLVLSDMRGGSPFNVTLAAMMELPFPHVTGMNLPMVLEVLMCRKSECLSDVVKKMISWGREGIIDAMDVLNEDL